VSPHIFGLEMLDVWVKIEWPRQFILRGFKRLLSQSFMTFHTLYKMSGIFDFSVTVLTQSWKLSDPRSDGIDRTSIIWGAVFQNTKGAFGPYQPFDNLILHYVVFSNAVIQKSVKTHRTA